jgi:plastocyanin
MPRLHSFRHPLIPIVAIAFALVAPSPAPTPARAAASTGHDMAGMSDADMQRAADAWFAKHPIKAPAVHSTKTATVNFNASGTIFDLDGNLSTQVDTAKINVGDIVTWTWISGSHTVTNGTGSADINAGTIFNSNLNTTTRSFSFIFDNAGTYPFFCIIHEGFNMRGVVIVNNPAGVTPGTVAHAGFVSGPAPVPSHGGVTFRYAMTRAGHARAEVFDVRGRRVAVALDRESGAGTFDGAWDGRTSSGERVSSGVYYVRLTLPGMVDSRRLVITD